MVDKLAVTKPGSVLAAVSDNEIVGRVTLFADEQQRADIVSQYNKSAELRLQAVYLPELKKI